MNRMQVGLKRLIYLAKKNTPIDIIYHKVDADGTDTAIPITAWTGTVLFKILDQNQQRMEWSDRDYMIAVEDLKVGEILFTPAATHWIEEVFPNPENNQHYELAAPQNEKVWRYADQHHLIYRLHTKKMKP